MKHMVCLYMGLVVGIAGCFSPDDLPSPPIFIAHPEGSDSVGEGGAPPCMDVGQCPNHCADGLLNADETLTDCGGADCKKCIDDTCTNDEECASTLCYLSPPTPVCKLRVGAPCSPLNMDKCFTAFCDILGSSTCILIPSNGSCKYDDQCISGSCAQNNKCN